MALFTHSPVQTYDAEYLHPDSSGWHAVSELGRMVSAPRPVGGSARG